MTLFSNIKSQLSEAPQRWLVTGAAGFIGSHLVETLLELGQIVTGFDDFSSGSRENLPRHADNFLLMEGDIRDRDLCLKACDGVDIILHQAAIGSVVKSIEEPGFVHDVNVTGFQNILSAAEKCYVSRVVYAGSSAVYGDSGDGPRSENHGSDPKSPYAQGKLENERNAANADIETIGLRYFNIYGPRQDPKGQYAAVIPRWIDAMITGKPVEIYGDGETIRDFCHVEDVVQANILAAVTQNQKALRQVYNIGSGQAATLNDLFELIKACTGSDCEVVYKDFREGDIRISQADISKAQETLEFQPSMNLKDGIGRMVESLQGASSCIKKSA